MYHCRLYCTLNQEVTGSLPPWYNKGQTFPIIEECGSPLPSSYQSVNYLSTQLLQLSFKRRFIWFIKILLHLQENSVVNRIRVVVGTNSCFMVNSYFLRSRGLLLYQVCSSCCIFIDKIFYSSSLLWMFQHDITLLHHIPITMIQPSYQVVLSLTQLFERITTQSQTHWMNSIPECNIQLNSQDNELNNNGMHVIFQVDLCWELLVDHSIIVFGIME